MVIQILHAIAIQILHAIAIQMFHVMAIQILHAIAIQMFHAIAIQMFHAMAIQILHAIAINFRYFMPQLFRYFMPQLFRTSCQKLNSLQLLGAMLPASELHYQVQPLPSLNPIPTPDISRLYFYSMIKLLYSYSKTFEGKILRFFTQL